MDERARTRAWRVAFYVAFLISAYGLLSPGSAIPRVELFPQVDKVEHLLSFAALAILARLGYPDKPRWGIWLALAFWGAATELAQRDIPGRSADVFDFAADAAGATVVFLTRQRARATRETRNDRRHE